MYPNGRSIGQLVWHWCCLNRLLSISNVILYLSKEKWSMQFEIVWSRCFFVGPTTWRTLLFDQLPWQSDGTRFVSMNKSNRATFYRQARRLSPTGKLASCYIYCTTSTVINICYFYFLPKSRSLLCLARHVIRRRKRNGRLWRQNRPNKQVLPLVQVR